MRYPRMGSRQLWRTTATYAHDGGDRYDPPSLAVGRAAPESMGNVGIRQRRTDLSPDALWPGGR